MMSVLIHESSYLEAAQLQHKTRVTWFQLAASWSSSSKNLGVVGASKSFLTELDACSSPVGNLKADYSKEIGRPHHFLDHLSLCIVNVICGQLASIGTWQLLTPEKEDCSGLSRLLKQNGKA